MSQCTEAANAARPVLLAEQNAMVHALLASDARVSVVGGKDGTGETFALDAASAAWEASGLRVIGAAVARRVAGELEEGAGIRSTSLAALLQDVRTGRPRTLVRHSVVVLDEASLVPSRDLAVLLEQLAAVEGKLVLVGDGRQLPSIRAGGAFDALATRLGAVELRENRRQTEAWERAALDLLRDGNPAAALDVYREHRRLVVGSDAPALREAIVSDWWKAQDLDGAIMIAFRRADVAELNGRARALMAAAGRLRSVSQKAKAPRCGAF